MKKSRFYLLGIFATVPPAVAIPADSKTEEFSGQPTDQTLEMKQGVAGPNALTLPPYTFRVIEL